MLNAGIISSYEHLGLWTVGKMSDYLMRFGGTARLYGEAGLMRLQAAHVCIVGIGGVGTWAAEALARSGLGKITLIDLDDVCITNTNRQVHALDGQIGKMKVAAMAERIRLINPDCQVHCIEDFVTDKNMQEYITTEFDYVVDAIDSVKAKSHLVTHCKRNKIPVIMTGGAGGQLDPTKVTIGDLNKTHNDPLAKNVRVYLRRHFNYSRNTSRNYGIQVVYSTEQLHYPQADGSMCHAKAFTDDSGTRLDCAGGFGAATMVTGTFGFVAAARVVQKIAGAKVPKKVR